MATFLSQGSSGWAQSEVTERVSAGNNVRPVLTVVMRFDKSSNTYTEMDCGKPSEGQCRFDPGTDVTLSLGEWAQAGGAEWEDASYINSEGAGENGFADKPHKKPLLRVTGRGRQRPHG